MVFLPFDLGSGCFRCCFGTSFMVLDCSTLGIISKLGSVKNDETLESSGIKTCETQRF